MSLAPDLHTNKLADRVADLVAELGDTADAIAHRLAEARITGRRADATCCPIANYLRQNVPCIDSIAVLGHEIDVISNAGDTATVPAPDVIEEFISLFDVGRYPHLLNRSGVRW